MWLRVIVSSHAKGGATPSGGWKDLRRWWARSLGYHPVASGRVGGGLWLHSVCISPGLRGARGGREGSHVERIAQPEHLAYVTTRAGGLHAVAAPLHIAHTTLTLVR